MTDRQIQVLEDAYTALYLMNTYLDKHAFSMQLQEFRKIIDEQVELMKKEFDKQS